MVMISGVRWVRKIRIADVTKCFNACFTEFGSGDFDSGNVVLVLVRSVIRSSDPEKKCKPIPYPLVSDLLVKPIGSDRFKRRMVEVNP